MLKSEHQRCYNIDYNQPTACEPADEISDVQSPASNFFASEILKTLVPSFCIDAVCIASISIKVCLSKCFEKSRTTGFFSDSPNPATFIELLSTIFTLRVEIDETEKSFHRKKTRSDVSKVNFARGQVLRQSRNLFSVPACYRISQSTRENFIHKKSLLLLFLCVSILCHVRYIQAERKNLVNRKRRKGKKKENTFLRQWQCDTLLIAKARTQWCVCIQFSE